MPVLKFQISINSSTLLFYMKSYKLIYVHALQDQQANKERMRGACRMYYASPIENEQKEERRIMERKVSVKLPFELIILKKERALDVYGTVMWELSPEATSTLPHPGLPADEQHHPAYRASATAPARAGMAYGRPPDLASNRATAHRLRCLQPPIGVSYTTTPRGLRPCPGAPTSTLSPPQLLQQTRRRCQPGSGCLATAGEKRRAALGWC